MSLLFITNCQTQNPTKGTAKSEIKPEKNDNGEWDLDVYDDRFDYFLTAIAKPIEMYSESYLKSKNIFLVNEWNNLYYTGKYRDVIESMIDYNSNENYGIKFEYKLYQVFAYVYWRYGLKLPSINAADTIY